MERELGAAEDWRRRRDRSQGDQARHARRFYAITRRRFHAGSYRRRRAFADPLPAAARA